jgi:hypothetical protein
MQKNIHKIKLGTAMLILLVGATACSHSTSSGKSGSVSANPVTKVSPIPAVTQDTLVNSLKDKGTLVGVQTSTIDSQYDVVSTTGDEKFYIKGGRLVSNSRRPLKGEKSLIYWRTQFRGRPYRETALTQEAIAGHERPLLEFACDSIGTGVIYDPSHEEVKRVFNYEAK